VVVNSKVVRLVPGRTIFTYNYIFPKYLCRDTYRCDGFKRFCLWGSQGFAKFPNFSQLYTLIKCNRFVTQKNEKSQLSAQNYNPIFSQKKIAKKMRSLMAFTTFIHNYDRTKNFHDLFNKCIHNYLCWTWEVIKSFNSSIEKNYIYINWKTIPNYTSIEKL
jgi:hypothetical protein